MQAFDQYMSCILDEYLHILKSIAKNIQYGHKEIMVIMHADTVLRGFRRPRGKKETE
jgi:hypothetical protein